MAIEYAGVDLLMPDNKSLQVVQDRHQTPHYALEPLRTAPDRRFPRFPAGQASDPPANRLNSLYWPTGASRFAVFHGLADKKRLDAIRDVIARQQDSEDWKPANNSELLKIGDGKGIVRATMWMMPPRPLFWTGAGKEPLYWLTLVDERYWWNQDDTGNDWLSDPPTTWKKLFDKIRDKLGVGDAAEGGGGGRWWMEGTVDGKYLYPHCVLAKAQFQPLGVILDAAAWSVGRQVVIQTDSWDPGPQAIIRGKIRIITPDTGDEIFTANYKSFDVYGGGRLDHGADAVDGKDDGLSLPAKIQMLFPVEVECNPTGLWFDAGIDTVTVAGFTTWGDLKGQVTVTNTLTAEDDPPLNGASLYELAQKWAEDWLHWLWNRNAEFVMIGVRPWQSDGYNDAIEWRVLKDDDPDIVSDEDGNLGREHVPRHRVITRLQPWPYRAIPSEVMHAESAPDPSLASMADCDECAIELPSEVICDEDTGQAVVMYDKFVVQLPNGETAKLRRLTGD